MTTPQEKSAERQIRLATMKDVPALSRTLGQAFSNDPFMNWLIQSPDKTDRFAAVFSLYLQSAIHQCKQTYTNETCTAGSIWIPPGKKHFSAVSDIFLVLKLVPLIGAATILSRLKGNAVMESHHPDTPHYYLLAVGVAPGNQGKGLGTQLLRPVLEKCDQQQKPAYLETSSEGVIGLYKKLGFEDRESFEIPYGGPTIWTMWREPQ